MTRTMGAREITSKFEMKCRLCDDLILQGDPCWWVKGLDQPAAWHQRHGQYGDSAPSVRSSTRPGEPTPAAVPQPPLLAAAPAVGPVRLESKVGELNDGWIQVTIGGWVPTSKAGQLSEQMIEAIRKARNGA